MERKTADDIRFCEVVQDLLPLYVDGALKRAASGPIPVEKAGIAVQTDGFQCRGTVVRQKSIDKTQQGVDAIHRRTSASAVKGEDVLIGQNQIVDHREIECGRGALQPA